MKLATAFYAAALALAPGVGLAGQGEFEPPFNNPGSPTFTFPLVVSPGAKACLNPDAEGIVITRGGIWAVSARWAECPSILSPTRVSESWSPGRAAKVELRGFTPS